MNSYKRRIAEKKKRKLFERVMSNFDLLYTSCFEMGKHYGQTENVKIAVLDIIKNQLKVKEEGEPNEVELYILVNRSFDNIYNVCKKKAKTMRGDQIPFAYLRHCIDKAKDGFEQGYTQAQDNLKNRK